MQIYQMVHTTLENTTQKYRPGYITKTEADRQTINQLFEAHRGQVITGPIPRVEAEDYPTYLQNSTLPAKVKKAFSQKPVADLCLTEGFKAFVTAAHQMKVLSGLLGDCAQHVVLDAAGLLHYWRSTVTVDALDLENTVVETVTGPLGTAYHDPKIYAFLPDLLPDKGIFTVPQLNRMFATLDFKHQVEQHQLTGLQFRLIWDSEDREYRDERMSLSVWETIKSMYQKK